MDPQVRLPVTDFLNALESIKHEDMLDTDYDRHARGQRHNAVYYPPDNFNHRSQVSVAGEIAKLRATMMDSALHEEAEPPVITQDLEKAAKDAYALAASLRDLRSDDLAAVVEKLANCVDVMSGQVMCTARSWTRAIENVKTEIANVRAVEKEEDAEGEPGAVEVRLGVEERLLLQQHARGVLLRFVRLDSLLHVLAVDHRP